ncbi:MAG: peptidoglycan editing factor PgeF [Oscillospiraceae bacterium]|nr:peptidoglycan editing factor PgeF [Oscillospiraceae bacterium]
MSIKNKRYGKVEYLKADGIKAPHCFTTRIGGVSTGIWESMNIANHRGDAPENVEENLRILGRCIGFEPEQLVLTRQTHSDIVRKAGAADCAGVDHHAYPECDALITNEPGVGLVVFTADCTPILLHDPVTGAVGAVHAGWRGTAAGIVAKAVEAMVREYGCDPANIHAAIGPNIGQCCFETDRDVPDALREALGSEMEEYIELYGDTGKYHVDLKEANAIWLRQAGVRNIEISISCTACRPDRYWSHRVTHGERGSQGAIILCKGAVE